MDPATTTNSATCLNPVTNTTGPNAYCRTQFNYNGKLNAINPTRMSPTSKIIYDITAAPGTADNPPSSRQIYTATKYQQRGQIPTITFPLRSQFSNRYLQGIPATTHRIRSTHCGNYPSNSTATIAADGFPDQASGIAYNPTATFAAAIGFTHVFSPTFFSETIVSQQWFGEHNYAGGKPFTNFESMLGLPNNFGEVGFPNFGSTTAVCTLWRDSDFALSGIRAAIRLFPTSQRSTRI